MAEVPVSWGLIERKLPDGALQLIGKSNDGSEYVARTCAKDHVTDHDLQVLAESDREKTTPRELVRRVVNGIDKRKADQEAKLEDGLMDAMGPVAHAGFHGFWSNGYGPGECDPRRPRKLRYRWNERTKTLELAEERNY